MKYPIIVSIILFLGNIEALYEVKIHLSTEEQEAAAVKIYAKFPTFAEAQKYMFNFNKLNDECRLSSIMANSNPEDRVALVKCLPFTAIYVVQLRKIS